MSRKREEQFEAPGKDSFLDVVANVVAILIILVIVVGSQASKAAIDREVAKRGVASNDIADEPVSAAEAAARSVELGVNELEQQIERQKFEIAYRRAERDQVQTLVNVAEQRLAQHRDQLSEVDREKYDLEAQLVASRGELAKLSQAQLVSSYKPPPIVLQHLPTPMARTVFGTEIHFRLLNHRLAYVPWEEVVERLKEDAKNHLHKLKDHARVELSLPEVAGFGARYILRRSEVEVETRVGTAKQTGIELEEVYLVDVEPNLGQPAGEAFAPGSELRSRLASAKPQNTTITIWVYPDSFEEFRWLKGELFKLGFLTAGRPMPHGKPISGSPSGSRSSAE